MYWVKAMPQLSLYLDKETLKKIESAAKKEKVPVSQWVRDRINQSFRREWSLSHTQTIIPSAGIYFFS
jgi:hypothetical protein